VPKDIGLGVATTFGQERDMPTWVACVARVQVDRLTGRVTVEKLTLVVDAGTIVHPDEAKAQVEGSSLWGSEFVNGLPKDTNLDTYTPLRMGDVPEIEVELMSSTEAPVGLGEPATTPVAPSDCKCDFRGNWRTSAPSANPFTGCPAGAQHPKLTSENSKMSMMAETLARLVCGRDCRHSISTSARPAFLNDLAAASEILAR
jgi:hypothetical protein